MEIGMIAGIILAIVSGIWLLVIAFKENVWWGFGCLLVPFVSLVFVVLNFKKTWLAFALNLVAAGIILASVASSMPAGESIGSLAASQQELQQKLERGEITQEQAEAETRKMLESVMKGKKYEPSQTGEVDIQASKPAMPEVSEETIDKARDSHRKAREQWDRQWKATYKQKREHKELGFVPVQAGDAEKYLHKNVRITTTRGQVREGSLLEVSSTTLVVGRESSSGTFSYNVNRGSVSKMEVEDWIVTSTPE